MKYLFTALILLLNLSANLSAKEKVNIIRCDRHAATSFAIITDNKTFQECEAEILAYREVLEEEGLGTYILHADWESPAAVREQIIRLSRKKPVLEGIVLVGDIPIAMVRKAQFMTTAFKMNENMYPEIESSVPSDRFYDDLDLEFDFIRRDSLQTNLFYYNLSDRGSQVLHSDIYSARIKVPAMMEGDPYEIMRKYLRKVVAAHQEKDNMLDHFTFFAGHGYNSDCLTLWRQKPIIFREHFPYAFRKASQNRFLNFRQNDEMKVNLANELQRKETDVFQFSEHGDYDTQYLNGTSRGDSFESNYENLKHTIASQYKRYKGTADDEPFLKEVLDSVYHLPREIVSDSAMASYDKIDSIRFVNANMYLDDLKQIRSNPRIVILNACYNGSFHNEKGYVAGFHVFGDGRCVVAQGNTVNVLQDKWEDKLLGYLSIGERAGMWQKEITFLESHMIGDPTFRFAPHNKEEKAICAQLHKDLIRNAGNAEIWKTYILSENPLLRAAGITHLSYLDADYSAEAFELLEKDPSWTVRLSSLNALSKYANENTLKGIEEGLLDSHEAIVRTAARMAGASGDETLTSKLEEAVERNPDMARVGFIAASSIKVLTPGSFIKNVQRTADSSLSDTKRISAIRLFRNNRANEAIEPLEAIVCNEKESDELRIVAAEALGWYNQSIEKEKIAEKLSDYLDHVEKDLSEEVRIEIVKAIKRLDWK